MHWLPLAGGVTLLVAALHFGCIVFGAEWYRFLGAGEHMAQLAARGDPYPTTVTGAIILVLLVWSAYAFSGAARMQWLPFRRTLLCLIASILVARGLGFAFLMPVFPDNSLTFWLVSSSLCLLLGMLYAVGIWQAWDTLSRRRG